MQKVFHHLTIITILAGTLTIFAGATFSQVCDEKLWDHVYVGDPHKFQTAKDRLKVVKPCITVTGTIFSIKPEADGDRHVRVTVDAKYKNLLNAKNISGQKGKLVIEPICQKPPTQADTVAEGVCDNYKQKIVIPKKGTRVTVTGVFITDMEHGWNEIHPITSVKITKTP